MKPNLDEVPGFDPIPRVQIFHIAVRPGEPIFWRSLSDLHLDESVSDRDYLYKQAQRDIEDYGSVRGLIIGDASGLIFPNDVRRYTPKVLRKELAVIGATVKGAVRSNAAFLNKLKYQWDLISLGNHETSALKYYGIDVADEIAGQIGARRGGYSGAIDYRIHVTKDGKLPAVTRGTPTVLFRMIYHHGNWGGDASKGLGKARAWAEQHDHWHLMLYGHNHKVVASPEVRARIVDGDIEEYPVYICDCGSASMAYSKDARDPGYAEIKGFRREPRKAPLIKFAVRWKGNRLDPEYSVTL